MSKRPDFFLSFLIFLFSLTIIGYAGYEFIQGLSNGYVKGRMGAVYSKDHSHYTSHLILYGVGMLMGLALCGMSLKWLKAR